MVTISKTGGPGLRFENEVVRLEVIEADGAFGGGGMSRGDVGLLKLVDGAYTGVQRVGNADNHRKPDQLLGVAMEDGLAGEKIRVGVRGVFDVLTQYNVSAKDTMMVSTSTGVLGRGPTNPLIEGTVYRKIVGIAQEDNPLTGSGSMITKVLFDGITGFACTAGTS